MSDYNRPARIYWWATIVAGALLLVRSGIGLARLGTPGLLGLGLFTVIVLAAGFYPIRLPNTQTVITPADVFVVMALLLWGVPAALLTATVDAAATSYRGSNRWTSRLGGPALMAISIFGSASLFEYSLKLLRKFNHYNTATLLLSLLLFSLVYFLLNSFLLATLYSLKRKVSLLSIWWSGYSWVWMTFAASAAGAGLVYLEITHFGMGALVAAVPLVGIVFAACHFYAKQVEEREKAIEQVSRVHLSTVEALATAIDAKDQITHDHVYRVQVYGCGLGKHFGLSKNEIEALKAGALLHDVGKIAVPDYILNKPGKLTAAEFDKMKIHTVVGAQIMERVNFPYPVVPIVRHHHERWDGRGYPDGLAGEKIPLTARILTVVDCFDAVREDRQYRKGLTREEACNFLSGEAGKQFDPNVVQAFLENLPTYEAEIVKHKAAQQPLLKPTTQAGLSESAMKAVPAAGLAQSEDGSPEYLKQIALAHNESALIYEITEMLSKNLDVENIVAETAKRIERAVPFTTFVVYIKEAEAGLVVASHCYGENADIIVGKRLAIGQGIAGWVVINGRQMINTDPMLDLEHLIGINNCDYRTTAVFPLTAANDTMGAIGLYSAQLASYGPNEIHLMESISRLISAALHRALLHEEVTNVRTVVTGPLDENKVLPELPV